MDCIVTVCLKNSVFKNMKQWDIVVMLIVILHGGVCTGNLRDVKYNDREFKPAEWTPHNNPGQVVLTHLSSTSDLLILRA